MDALTWFKSVFQRAEPNGGPLRAGFATEAWADVPLHVAAARLRPSPPPDDDDDDWDVVIARAKMHALPRPASLGAARPLPPPSPRDEWAGMPATPPPAPAPAPRAWGRERANATLDGLLRGGLKKPGAPLPAFAARRPAEEDLATPLPLGKARRAAGP